MPLPGKKLDAALAKNKPALVLSPFALLGVWIGVKAHYMISEKLFFAFTYILLTLTGLRLIWVAII